MSLTVYRQATGRNDATNVECSPEFVDSRLFGAITLDLLQQAQDLSKPVGVSIKRKERAL